MRLEVLALGAAEVADLVAGLALVAGFVADEAADLLAVWAPPEVEALAFTAACDVRAGATAGLLVLDLAVALVFFDAVLA